MKVVIPSRGRSKAILERTLKHFPGATVCVEPDDLSDYHNNGIENLLVHPKLPTLAQIRNWILDNVPDEMIFMPDDDLMKVVSMVGYRPIEITDPVDVMQIVDNAGYVAKHIGAGYFGFNNNPDPKQFSPLDPVRFSGWVGSQVGHVGRRLRYDDKLSLYDDCDFSLLNMLKLRVIYLDNRFVFECYKTLRSPGGNSNFRSSQTSDREASYMKEKWGRWVGVGKLNTPFITPGTVKRRQG